MAQPPKCDHLDGQLARHILTDLDTVNVTYYCQQHWIEYILTSADAIEQAGNARIAAELEAEAKADADATFTIAEPSPESDQAASAPQLEAEPAETPASRPPDEDDEDDEDSGEAGVAEAAPA